MTVAALHEVPRQSPTNLVEAVAFYAAHDLSLTPVRPGDKAGYKKAWSAPGHSATLDDFNAADNVGVLNGTQPCVGWFFHDIDIDANFDAARRIVERLLPPTGWRYGRASKPRSHANYLLPAALRTRKYHGAAKSAILELRGLTKKDTHSLSVGPGSTWTDGTRREPIRFLEPRGNIGRSTDVDAFEGAVQLAAVGIIIAEVWPATTGHRHDLRLAFSKVLLDHGLSQADCRTLLEAVMEATGSDVADVPDVVRDTATKLATERTAGRSVVVDVLGDTGRAALDAIARALRSSEVDESTGIVMRGGDVSAIVDRAEAALLDLPIYQRGGGLVRPVRLDQLRGEVATTEVRRDAGATVLADVRETWLCEQMGRVLRWFKRSRDGGMAPADPATVYARTLLARAEWRFPVLRGVVTAPTLAADGRIIEAPGYDAASGLLLDFAPAIFAQIPERPTKDEARAALGILAHPLRAFPFVDKAAESVALSAILTALVRGSLRTSPLHGFDAPTAGTGKSLLAELPGLIATGVKPPALSQGKSDEEDEKRLSTVLAAGDPTIHIDNCERPITGDFLCSMLSQEVVQARILGQSERRILPCTALVLTSGNNLAFAGDTSRRAVVCRLDAVMERPEQRHFDFDCHAEVLAHRPALVVAGLAVLRAYRLAGNPERLTPMGSFADWEWIRGALVWLGRADPAETRAAITDNDPRKNDLLEIMDLWAASIGTAECIEVAEIDRRAEMVVEHKDSSAKREADRNQHDAAVLRAKLVEVSCRSGKWSGTSVGRWLTRHKDRVVGGRSFVCRTGGGRGVMAWRLVERTAVSGQQELLET